MSLFNTQTDCAPNKVCIGKICFNPALNPGVLDTATWNSQKALEMFNADKKFVLNIARILEEGGIPHPQGYIGEYISLMPQSLKKDRNTSYIFGRFVDGQRAVLIFCKNYDTANSAIQRFSILGEITQSDIAGEKTTVLLVPATIENIRYFISDISPISGPQPLGHIPRLGIGIRMTSLCLPGIFDAMKHIRVSVNPIQNSVGRELMPLRRFISSNISEQTYLPGLGTLLAGHTGSTIEGLWLEGVMSAIEQGYNLIPFGADADHIPVKREKNGTGIEKAKELITCAKDFTLFTLDTSDIFNYDAMRLSKSALEEMVSILIPAPLQREDIINRHMQPYTCESLFEGSCVNYKLTREQVNHFIVKYWQSINAAETLDRFINSMRGKKGYDLEFSLDERPLDVTVEESVTTPEELIFILREIKYRGVHLTHIAPNFGIEKGVDYRLSDGLEYLGKRINKMAAIARDNRVILDFHSGDDLSCTTRQCIAQATGGYLHYKISPVLQNIYAEVLEQIDPKRFAWWWNLTLDYVKNEVSRGAEIAVKYLKVLGENRDNKPSSKDIFFWNYCFAIVGARDENGNFLYREMFYDVSSIVKEEYRRRVKEYIIELAHDLSI